MNRQVICLVGRVEGMRVQVPGWGVGVGVGEEKGRRCCRRTSDKDSGYLSAPGGGVGCYSEESRSVGKEAGPRAQRRQFLYEP